MYSNANAENRVYDILPYSLPQLHTGKKWYVDFYCFDPVVGQLKRKKYFLDRYKTVAQKKARASEIIETVTNRLRSGWNVWIKTESTREQTSFTECLELYKTYLNRSVETGHMKSKTAYGYLSFLGIFMEWLQQRLVPVKFCYQVDNLLLTDFLDYVYIDREGSACTRNNYLTWLSTLCAWMVSKGYLKENPTAKIKKLPKDVKKRNALTSPELSTLQHHLNKTNKYFLLACLMEYYTFIRPVELAQIKLEHISIKDQRVYVPGEISKNRKDGMVGLNDEIIRLMIDLKIFEKPSHCFLFGKDFKPSEKQADSRIFREYFMKVREELKWDDSKQFYSLKDSGIRDLANAEGIVVARDQARHSDIATTNKYLKGDSMVVHEQTKHFKGALSVDKPTQSESAEVPTEVKTEKKTLSTTNEGAFSGKRESCAAPSSPCAPSHTARKTPSAECPDSAAQPVKSASVPPATEAKSAEPIPEPKKTESAAETARDFKSLISEKVGTPKRKRRRIGQEAIFSTTDPYKNRHK